MPPAPGVTGRDELGHDQDDGDLHRSLCGDGVEYQRIERGDFGAVRLGFAHFQIGPARLVGSRKPSP